MTSNIHKMNEMNEQSEQSTIFSRGKYSSKDWERFEVNVKPFEKQVIEMLKQLADKSRWESLPETILPSCSSFYKEKRQDKQLCK